MESARRKKQSYNLAAAGLIPSSHASIPSPWSNRNHGSLSVFTGIPFQISIPVHSPHVLPSVFHQVDYNSFFKTWSGSSLCKQSIPDPHWSGQARWPISVLPMSPERAPYTASQFFTNIIQKLFINSLVYAANWLYNSKYDRHDSSTNKAYLVRRFFTYLVALHSPFSSTLLSNTINVY